MRHVYHYVQVLLQILRTCDKNLVKRQKCSYYAAYEVLSSSHTDLIWFLPRSYNMQLYGNTLLHRTAIVPYMERMKPVSTSGTRSMRYVHAKEQTEKKTRVIFQCVSLYSQSAKKTFIYRVI